MPDSAPNAPLQLPEFGEFQFRFPANPSADQVVCYFQFTIDGAFVIDDCRIVDTPRGRIVAMPRRPAFSHCDRCGGKVFRNDKFCRHCGVESPLAGSPSGREHYDVSYPVTRECRRLLEDRCFAALEAAEKARSKAPARAC